MSTAPTIPALSAGLRAAVAILGLICLAPSLPAQVVVEGHVFVRTHDLRLFPVQGVNVRAQRSTGWGTLAIHSPNVTTDASGRYSLTLNAGSGPGDYDLYASFPGATQGALSVEYSNNMFLTGPIGTEAELLAPKAALNSGLNSGYDIYWPQPIAFLHGMASNRSSWACVSNYFRNTWAQTGGSGCLPSPRRIPRRGYITARLEYDWASILPLPSALAEIQALRNLLAPFGLRHVPIDLVAHSYGGLMARAMLTDPASTGEIDRIYTFGTPHGGSLLVDLWAPYPWFLGQCLMNNGRSIHCALAQLHPRYVLGDFWRLTAPALSRAQFFVVGASSDINTVLPGSSVWPQLWPGGQPFWIGWDDGVVTTWSSVVVPTSSTFGLPVFDQHVVPVHHLGLTSDERSFIDVLLVDLESSQPWG